MPVSNGLLQRKCACGGNPGVDGECAECHTKRLSLQRQTTMPATSSQTVPSIVHEVLGSPGHSLDAGARAFMEPRFGHNFSKVKVHTDTKAAQSARAVNALAYTVGSDVVFGRGQYSPGTSTGKKLLAHELTHTIQQSQGEAPTISAMHVNEPGDIYEREADLVSRQVIQVSESQSQQGLKISSPAEGIFIQRLPTKDDKFPMATFTDFVTEGNVRCCNDKGRNQCPPHLGPAEPGDPRPQNGMNLVASIAGHRPGIEYGFVQIIHFQRCIRFSAALGGAWQEVGGPKGPGLDDSPVADATCPIPNHLNEITMTDAPGFQFSLGQPANADTEELTQRMNATNWVIAREKPGTWQKISDLFQWHSITRIRRNAAGNWELTPGGNHIGRGYTRIGGCPPPP